MRTLLRRFLVVLVPVVVISLTACAARAYATGPTDTSHERTIERPGAASEAFAQLTYAILSLAGMTTMQGSAPSAY